MKLRNNFIALSILLILTCGAQLGLSGWNQQLKDRQVAEQRQLVELRYQLNSLEDARDDVEGVLLAGLDAALDNQKSLYQTMAIQLGQDTDKFYHISENLSIAENFPMTLQGELSLLRNMSGDYAQQANQTLLDAINPEEAIRSTERFFLFQKELFSIYNDALGGVDEWAVTSGTALEKQAATAALAQRVSLFAGLALAILLCYYVIAGVFEPLKRIRDKLENFGVVDDQLNFYPNADLDILETIDLRLEAIGKLTRLDQAIEASAASPQSAPVSSDNGMEQALETLNEEAGKGMRLMEQADQAASHADGKMLELKAALVALQQKLSANAEAVRAMGLVGMNATIVAARAGERGEGFAKVAEEVKELASSMAVCNAEISACLQTLDASSEDTGEALSDVAATVNKAQQLSLNMAGIIKKQHAALGKDADEVINQEALEQVRANIRRDASQDASRRQTSAGAELEKFLS